MSCTLARNVIDQAALLREFAADGRDTLATAATLKRYRTGEYLWRVGDRKDALEVVAEGVVQVGIMIPDAREIMLHVLPRGECMGEEAIYPPGSARWTDGRAAVRTTIVAVPGDTVRAVLDARPEAMRIFVQRVAEIARTYARRLALTAFHDGRGRVAQLILDLALSHSVQTPRGRRIEIPLSQRTLAGLVGLRRESASRILSALRSDGALVFEGGKVTIVSELVLRSALGPGALVL